MPSQWEQFKQKWGNCKACTLCKTRKNIVLTRGSIPATLLFIGESPGAAEDVLGRPFVGPAGHLLNRIIAMAEVNVPYCLTNIICCIPIGEEGTKTAEPPREAIDACQPRLEEFIQLCQPKTVIAVGELAAKNMPKLDCPMVKIAHPAFILRQDITQRPLSLKRCVVTISDALYALQNPAS